MSPTVKTFLIALAAVAAYNAAKKFNVPGASMLP